jgi:hypothetical protein
VPPLFVSTARTLALVALLALPGTALCASADWGVALPADAVASYFEGQNLRVLVVPAGADAKAAASALTAAVAKAPAVALAMPADGLGDVSALDDAAIVAKANTMPIDLVAIGRVFAGKDGTSSLVVTIYMRGGAAISAFSAATNAPLVAKKAGAPATGGMAGGSASVVDGVVGGNTIGREAAIKAFEERAVWMQGYAAVDSGTGRIVSTWSVPMQGKYGEALKGAKFYEYVGKPEYAATYKKRQLTRGVLFAAGAAVAAGGGAYWGAGLQETAESYKGQGSPCWGLLDGDYEETPEYRTCAKKITDANKTVTMVAGTLVGLGTVTLIVPFFIDAHPVKSNERSRLVDEYNDALKKELGLASFGAAPSAPQYAAGAWATPSGGGVTLSGEF